MIAEVMFARLSGAAAVAALVGARIHPLEVPQASTFPAVTYQQVSGPRDHSSRGPTGTANLRVQVDCWAESYDGAIAVAKVVREALDGYRGSQGGATVVSTVMLTERDLSEPTPGLKRISQDYSIYLRE